MCGGGGVKRWLGAGGRGVGGGGGGDNWKEVSVRRSDLSARWVAVAWGESSGESGSEASWPGRGGGQAQR